MKIRELQLLAFGPFTEKTLNFSDGNFHIVFGPNEAGKSSALRAVSDFLYGIPTRSTDHFLHSYREMRLGAILENAAGIRSTFLRRKGNRDTLLNVDGEPRPDSEIDSFLGNVSRELFLQMFGLSHQRLIEGGKDIVSGKGDVGESIFSAGMGVTGLRKLLGELEKQAEDLFKPAGQNPAINRLLKDLQNAQKALSESSLTARAYKEKFDALAEINAKREALRKNSTDLTNRLDRLERLQNAAPKAAQLAQHQADRHELGPVVLLSHDFPERRRKISEERRAAQTEIETLQADIEHLKSKIDANKIEDRILELKTEITDLFQSRGVFIKSRNDLPILKNERRTLHESAEVLLGRLGLPKNINEAENLRLTSPQRARITLAADQLKDLRQEISKSEKQKQDLQAKIAVTETELKTLSPLRKTDSLHRTAKTANSIRHQVDEQKNLETEIHDLQTDAAGRFQRLLPPPGSQLEDIGKLPLPSPETIQRFERESNTHTIQLNQLEKEIAEILIQQEKLSLQIQSVKKGETVPSEEQLAENRARRDRGWKLVRLSWEGPQPEAAKITEFTADEPLADVYEKTVTEADKTADELRRESSRVAELKQLGATEKQLQEKFQKLLIEKKSVLADLNKWTEDWQKTWFPAKISPLSPAEMLPWQNEIQDLLKTLREIEIKRVKLKGLTTTIEETRNRLIAESEKIASPIAPNLSFPELLDQAESTLEKIDQENQKRRQTENDLANLAEQLEQTKRNLTDSTARKATARSEWGETVAPLGLFASSQPEEAQIILHDIGEVFQKLDEARSRQDRIEQIKNEHKVFEKSVTNLLERLGETTENTPPQETVARLNQRLLDSQKNSELSQAFQQDISKKEQTLNSAKTRMTALTAQIKELLKEAKTEDEERLSDLELTSQNAQKLEQSIDSLRQQILDFCRGETLDELIAAIGKTDIDSLPGEIQQLQTEQDELQQQLSQLGEEVGSLRTQLNQLDGNPAAALKAQEIEEIKAELKVKIEEFARARLASTLLRREIERYREKHQGPVLQRTGEIFSRLTLGSFSGLGTDFTDKDEQILVGLRADDTKVPVEGMSEGTCDQLYLALRLASLEHHIENNEPMPLILDDILVNFDDDRARATLEILSEISGKNQIIYFTHHRHILEIAQPLQTTIHELSPDTSTDSLSSQQVLSALS